VDEIYESPEKFLRETLGFPSEQIIQMDLTKLVLSGHSFGGMTAIAIA
jgi:hypothetical protein